MLHSPRPPSPTPEAPEAASHQVKPVPLVSVIIPAYNAEKYIAETLESALAQTLQDIEIIVVDDGSKDATASVVQGFPQVRCIRKTNAGVSAARNHAVSHASGEFLAFLDSDDIWHPDKLRQQVDALRKHPDSVFSRTEYTCEPADLPRLKSARASTSAPHLVIPDLQTSFLAPYFTTSTVMVRRSAFDEARGFDSTLRIAEDVDFYLRVLAKHPKLILMTEQLVYKRPVAGSLGDDSEAGYIQLLQVYDRFLAQEPEARASLGKHNIAQAYQRLQLDLARCHLEAGHDAQARHAAWAAMRHGPTRTSWTLILKSILPKSMRRTLRSLKHGQPDS